MPKISCTVFLGRTGLKSLYFLIPYRMDDRTTHEDDELLDTEEKGEQKDTAEDEDATPADTEEEPEDDPKTVAKENQRKAWLENIKSGKKTLEDMPDNLGWLKKDLKKELEPEKKEVKADDLDEKIRNVLTEREAKEEFEYLVDDLKDSDLTEEQEAQLRQEYENIISDYKNPSYAVQLKALTLARRLTGLKDSSETVKERRRKGMALPPLGGRKRSIAQKDKETETEKRLGGNLPPGFKA